MSAPHLHVLFLDGVYTQSTSVPVFHAPAHRSTTDAADAGRVWEVVRGACRAPEGSDTEALVNDSPMVGAELFMPLRDEVWRWGLYSWSPTSRWAHRSILMKLYARSPMRDRRMNAYACLARGRCIRLGRLARGIRGTLRREPRVNTPGRYERMKRREHRISPMSAVVCRAWSNGS